MVEKPRCDVNKSKKKHSGRYVSRIICGTFGVITICLFCRESMEGILQSHSYAMSPLRSEIEERLSHDDLSPKGKMIMGNVMCIMELGTHLT